MAAASSVSVTNTSSSDGRDLAQLGAGEPRRREPRRGLAVRPASNRRVDRLTEIVAPLHHCSPRSQASARAAWGVAISTRRVSGRLNDATGAGGGLRTSGHATVRRTTISGNEASGSVLANGGGLSGSGFTLLRTTVSGNSSAAQGGGVFGSGAILNSTISGNTTATRGGGLSTSGTLSLLHVTVAGNTAADAGNGLHRFGSGSSLTLQSTILANGPGAECASLLPTSTGSNLSSDASCGLTAAGDLQSTPAQLGSLALNGGTTRTRLPAATSPALNASTLSLTSDQRGVSRPQGPGSDIGAVERE